MITITTLLFSFLLSTVSADPHCFKYGAKLYGKDLDVPCVHHTDEYSVAFDVVDGSVEVVLGQQAQVPALELYSEPRIVNDWEDCCPPPSFVQELTCGELSQAEEGSCCVSDTHVHVTGLHSHYVGCVHSVEDYVSHLPEGGSVSWETSDPGANHEVEVYASVHPNGCCSCFLYSLPCGECDA